MIWASPLWASPWTLPADEGALSLSYDFSSANKEFLPEGEFEGLQEFPLDGQFNSSRLAVGFRYGFTEKVEGELDVAIKQVNFESTPFVNGNMSEVENRSTLYNGSEGIYDFSSTSTGFGDFRFKGRYNFWSKDEILKLTTETSLKLPGGYEEPSGTFQGDEQQLGQIADDVTLGDGQVDVTQKLLFGGFIVPTRTFVRVEAGFRHRFGPPGDQGSAGLKVGQNLGQNLLLFVSSQGTLTVTEGSSIGKSFISTEPDAEPYEMSGGPDGNVRQIPLTLDKDFLQLGGGMIVRLSAAEVQLSYRQIVWGRNIPAIKTASISTVFSFPDLTAGGKTSAKKNGEGSEDET